MCIFVAEGGGDCIAACASVRVVTMLSQFLNMVHSTVLDLCRRSGRSVDYDLAARSACLLDRNCNARFGGSHIK